MKKQLINYFIYSSVLALLATGCSNHPSVEIVANNFTKQSNAEVDIQSFGDGQYKIGNISVNKADKSFQVTGKFIRLDAPIEFLAVAKDGDRGYESLLELDVDVFQFNLACILIGLDKNKGEPPKHHFDTTPLEGDSVEIWISWENNGKNYHVEAANLFKIKDSKLDSGEWVYTGSSFTPGKYGDYLPKIGGGTLIGITHDPSSIIEHRIGFGRGSFSEIKLDESLPISIDMSINIQIKYID